MTTLFAFFEIAFGPTKHVSMRNDEKFCSIRIPPTSKNTTTKSLTTKLLYKKLATADGTHDALCQLKFCQLLHNCKTSYTTNPLQID